LKKLFKTMDYEENDLNDIGFTSSSEDDGGRRKVVKKKTAKERQICDALNKIIADITEDEFRGIPDQLKNVARLAKLLRLDWKALIRIPKFYCHRIVEIQRLIVAKDRKSLQKELERSEFDIFKKLQNNVKRFKNIEYFDAVTRYNEDPADWAEEPTDLESDEEESESEEEQVDEESAAEEGAGSDYSELSEFSESDDGDEWGSDDEKGEGGYGPWSAKQVAKMKHREFWLDQSVVKDEQELEDERIAAKNRKKKEAQERNRKKQARKEAEAKKKKKTTTKTLKHEDVCKRLKKIWESRHKKSELSGKDPITELEDLKQWIDAERQSDLLLTNLSLQILLAFDSTGIRSMQTVTKEQWNTIIDRVKQVLTILEGNKKLRLHPAAEMKFLDVEDEDDKKNKKVLGGIMAVNKPKKDGEDENEDEVTFEDAEREQRDAELRKGFDPNLTYIRGQLSDYCGRLLKAWTLALKGMRRELHSEEYQNRLADQDTLLELLVRSRAYSTSIDKDGSEGENQAVFALLELQIRHSIFEPELNVLSDPNHVGHAHRVRNREAHCTRVLAILDEKKEHDVVKLTKIVWSTPNSNHSQQCTQATLYLVFWLALHNDYRNARDLLQASHLSPHNVDGYIQDADVKWYIGMCEPATQAIFNRCIARIAVAAFGHGNFAQCLKMFYELCHSQKIKELMAQHVKVDWWKREKTREEEAIEFAEGMRILPDHLHFNIDLMESVHFICAMFHEIPLWLTNKNKRQYTKSYFRKYFENYLKKDMTGPSSNTRFTIMEAGKAMSQGDWMTCYKLIAELKFWNEMENIDQVRQLTKDEIKKQSLRCYMFQFGPMYKSIQMQKLCERFELDRETVQKHVSGFCIEYELPARYDQISECYVITRGNPTPIQKLCLSYMDKFDSFVELNQKLVPGSYRYNNRRNQSGGGRGGRDNRRHDSSRKQSGPGRERRSSGDNKDRRGGKDTKRKPYSSYNARWSK